MFAVGHEPFVCVQVDIHITGLCYWLLFYAVKQSFSQQTSNLKLSNTCFSWWLVCSCPQFWLSVNSKQNEKIHSPQSSGTEFPLLCRQMCYWGSVREKMARGRWRRGKRQSNHSFVKTFVFSEKGQFSSWERLWSSSALPVALLWKDVGFRKSFFLHWGGRLSCLLCLQRQEGVWSASSLSQECSAIWEVSTWGQGMTSVTSYQPNTFKVEHSHAQLCWLVFCHGLTWKSSEWSHRNARVCSHAALRSCTWACTWCFELMAF